MSKKSSFIEEFNSRTLFPLYHNVFKTGLWPLIKKYQKSQWYSIDELRYLQSQKLSKLLIHCQNQVPYYKELFNKLGFTAQELVDYNNFCRIPPLTKKIINKNRDQIIASNFTRRDLINNSTSGSTGESLYFYNDKQSMLHRQSVVYRSQEWVHCLYADKKACIWGSPFDIKRSKKLKERLHGVFNRTILLSSYDLSDESMLRYFHILKRYGPRLLVSYPSPLTTFSEFLLKNNMSITGLRSIITSAETLFYWQREIIEKAFSCAVFDRYGCREFGNIAHECDRHEGYHINMERFFLEILDENDNPCAPGEVGEIYVTDLDNYGFPFVRYKIGDMAISSDKFCSCGRGLPILESIQGRSFDIIKAPNGNRIGGTFWTLALRSVPGIDNFQIEQNTIGTLKVKLVTNNNFTNKTETKIAHIIKEKCGNEMEIKFVYVNSIALTKSGKRKFVISKIHGD
jgi:phenylacetate-CoA ligase